MKASSSDIRFVIAIVFAIWFAFTGFFWAYWIALFIAYPFGIISFLLWLSLRTKKEKRMQWIPIILLVGLSLSLGMLIYLLLAQ